MSDFDIDTLDAIIEENLWQAARDGLDDDAVAALLLRHRDGVMSNGLAGHVGIEGESVTEAASSARSRKPRTGSSMSDESDDDQLRAFARVGRDLLSFELETMADDLQYEFRKASKKASNSDRITEADARRLAHAMERADMFVDAFYDACPDADRPPAIEDLVSTEELQEITARSPVQGGADADE